MSGQKSPAMRLAAQIPPQDSTQVQLSGRSLTTNALVRAGSCSLNDAHALSELIMRPICSDPYVATAAALFSCSTPSGWRHNWYTLLCVVSIWSLTDSFPTPRLPHHDASHWTCAGGACELRRACANSISVLLTLQQSVRVSPPRWTGPADEALATTCVDGKPQIDDSSI